MDLLSCHYYLRLAHSKSVAVKVFSRLLREYGSVRAIQALESIKLEAMGFDKTQIEYLTTNQCPSDVQRRVDAALEWNERADNHIIGFESAQYPALLREIDCAPPLLYVRGSVSALHSNLLAIVGSRKATHYGKRCALWMSQELGRAGLNICSGLAVGVDTKAHEGALAGGAQTIAVLGTGIDRRYPAANRKLADEIIGNGALLSEFPLGMPPYPSNFPRRNRIISGLAQGTLVVEAKLKSGTLVTARLALEQNRDVFALPGPITSPQSRGCHSLIQQGAILVEKPEDILQELGIKDGREPNDTGSTTGSEETSIVLRSVDRQGSVFQAIQNESRLRSQDLHSELIRLEIEGFIRQEGGRYFRLD